MAFELIVYIGKSDAPFLDRSTFYIYENEFTYVMLMIDIVQLILIYEKGVYQIEKS